MNTGIITEALRQLNPESLTWKFALYSTSKSRDGIELEWHLCSMKGIPGQVDTIKEHLLKKPVAEKSVEQYSPFVSYKESISAMTRNDEVIRSQISDILLNIRNGQEQAPEDFITGAINKPAGYAFYGESRDADGNVADRVLFMRRGNPFLTGQAAKLFIGSGNHIAPCNVPVLKFTAAADFLMVGDICYIFSSAVEKDFSLESRHFAIAQKRMELIADAAIVSDYERFEASVMKAKNARKFLDFDKNILEHITKLPIVEREDFLSTYGVTIDHEGRMDTFDVDQCELIIDLLCCRSFLDPLGRLSTGSNIIQRD